MKRPAAAGSQTQDTSVHIEDCEGCWLSSCRSSCSGRALAAKARGVLGLSPGSCRSFHFFLFLSHKI